MRQKLRHLPVVLCCLVAAACAPDNVIEFEIVGQIEQEHWSLNGEMTCIYRYKVLNNTDMVLRKLNASLVWRDTKGADIESVFILESDVLPNEATNKGLTPVMAGACSQIQYVGIKDVLRCELGSLDRDQCIARLRTRYNIQDP